MPRESAPFQDSLPVVPGRRVAAAGRAGGDTLFQVCFQLTDKIVTLSILSFFDFVAILLGEELRGPRRS